MFRFLFRVLATLALCVSVIMMVIDATRSIAADAVVLTPLAESWEATSPSSFAATEKLVREAMLGELWDPIGLTMLSAPGFVVFLVLALLFYMVGHRRQRRRDRFAAI